MKKVVTLSCILLFSSVCYGDCCISKNYEESVFDKNIGSIITGIISFIAIITSSAFSYYISKRTLDRQANIQLATTINKDWNEKVRGYVAEIIKYYIIIEKIRLNHISPDKSHINISLLPEVIKATDDFRDTRIILSLYLNFSNPDQDYLYNTLTQKLWNKIVLGTQKIDGSSVIIEIQTLVQKICTDKENLF